MHCTQAKFPNLDIKATQDNTTSFFGRETDDVGRVTELGALSLLIQELKDRGLECDSTKLACVGTTPDVCAFKKKKALLS